MLLQLIYEAASPRGASYFYSMGLGYTDQEVELMPVAGGIGGKEFSITAVCGGALMRFTWALQRRLMRDVAPIISPSIPGFAG